ncbi:MAG TPA: hypothetical protein VIU61_11350 [Kofleriaceae bacterium]
MNSALALIGSLLVVGFVAIAAAGPGTSEPAPDAEPAWSCGQQDHSVWRKVNECRAKCSEGKDAKRQQCLDTMRSCRSACADDAACKTKCVDDGNACIRNSETEIKQCGERCVTDTPGCTL